MNNTIALPVARQAGNLPADMTSFLGRRHEISQVKQLLSKSRLITLTGPGGVGKTRLSLRIAGDMRRTFHNHVWFIELGELRNPDLLANTVAEKLGLYDQSNRAAIETVMEFLSADGHLLVLDNCEHLVDACATFVSTLLHTCPELRILATSRQSLGIMGESIFAVTAFPVPATDRVYSPESIAQYDSVRLFVERATAVVPQFTVDTTNCAALAQVCHHLDGIPLAIELTAVRLRALSLEQILRRLAEHTHLINGGAVRGTPERQRTLKALIDWSHELCSPQEQKVWARASVFSGSFDLEAAEHVVAGEDVTTAEVCDAVNSLVDKSIFLRVDHQDTIRYRLLHPMREYGEQRLREYGEYDEVRRRHRDWYAGLASRFDAEWIGHQQVSWIDRLRAEHPNLRVALDYCASEPGEAVTGLRLATQLDDYWGIRGLHTELRHWLNTTLRVAPEPIPERLSALRMCGWFAVLQGDIEIAMSRLAQAEKLAAEVNVPVEEAYLVHAAGMASLVTGELDKATKQLSEALKLFRQAGCLRGELFSLFTLGLTIGLNGDLERGNTVLDECLARTERLGDQFWRSWALWSVGHIELVHGSLDRGEKAAREALEIQHQMENRLGIAFDLDMLGWTAELRGRHTRAAELFGAAEAVWHAIGASPDFYVTFAAEHHRNLDRAAQALGTAAFEKAFRRGRTMPSGKAVSYALESREAAPPPQAAAESPLTKREKQIAELVADGMSNRDIAESLVISQRTAEAHVEHILTKLGFTSRTQIATWVLAQGSAQQ